MKKVVSLLIVVLVFAGCRNHTDTLPVTLVPYPAQLKQGNGQFELSTQTQLAVNDGGLFSGEVAYLQAMITKTIGSSLPSSKSKNMLVVQNVDGLQPEAYHLEITNKQVTLSAGDAAGMFYAIQTLRQLLPPAAEQGNVGPSAFLPVLTVSDHPAFGWRGMHLDVSRHFFSIDYLKKHIDRLSLYKFNKLHLHLTDDQGWRVEIKKYPKLTEEGAWRTFNNQDSVCMKLAKENPDFVIDSQHIITKDGKQLYGGFYTQEQLRDLVQYAQARHVELIPEIDMPGHMMAAINSYLYLSATGSAGWGSLFTHPLCPCNEQVYQFVEDVLSEIIDIFPSKYVHIGADEVDKSTWATPKCRDFMKKHGLADVDKLQSYFVQRVQDFLTSKGKETIAWDEALEGGINPDVNIMYWRTWVGDVAGKAIANGNKVIVASGNPLYFSQNQPLYNIYHVKIIPKGTPADRVSQVLGAQACVWTERTPSEKRADKTMFPGMLALSEAVWSSKEIQNWEDFKYRLEQQLPRLDYLGINYAYQPSYALIPIMQVDTVQKRIGFIFDSEKYQPEIYYTLDGTTPTPQSTRYNGEFYITGSAAIRAAIFVDGNLQEPMFSKQVDYHKAIGKKVTYLKPWNMSYPAGDAGTLTDGYRGGSSYNDGRWQGFTNDLDVVVDMGKPTVLNNFSATFIQTIGPGVYMPGSVEVSLSDDGVTFEKVLTVENDVPKDKKGWIFKDFSGSLAGKTARYIKVVASNQAKEFIFTDEIVIN